MILLALLVPALMMAFLFGMDALENLLFPRPAAADDVGTPTDDIQARLS
ncbi:membrane protein [Streptomyces resistomycificus]|uniref:Membrane protein n=1 Tax=Streptomyces resistomycificus TaxID=67356 RepID=A0A0L8L4P3_9ACTN|nr:membrane protein [Streptomyces resistomycificus]